MEVDKQAMETAAIRRATHVTIRNLDFTSEGMNQLRMALELFFVPQMLRRSPFRIVWAIDEHGFHAAESDDGHILRHNMEWTTFDPDGPRAKDPIGNLAANIIEWLDGPSEVEKERIASLMPAGAFVNRDQTPALTGFSVKSSRSPDGLRYMATITPAWV